MSENRSRNSLWYLVILEETRTRDGAAKENAAEEIGQSRGSTGGVLLTSVVTQSQYMCHDMCIMTQYH